MASNGKMPTIGDRGNSTSYPDPKLAGHIGSGDMNGLGAPAQNWNAANYPENPDVLNESPATKKSYSWNRGETGNAT
jgi:hypothetical protein